MSYAGKTIEIHRNFNMLALAQNDPEVIAWYGQSFRAIGPNYDAKAKAPSTGLTFEEQKILMPELLGIEYTDKDFRRAVVAHYHSILTLVRAEGLKLQISLNDDNMPLSLTNMPVNLADYITYRHLLKHPDVAADKASAERNYNAKFFILDPDGVSKGAVAINDLEDKAFALYTKFKDDQIKTDQILTMLGVNTKKLKPEDKVLKFKELARKSPNLNEFEQRNSFDHFIKTVEDKDIEYRFLIQEMIGAQYLTRVGKAISYTESGDTIGQNMDEVVMYFKNPKNSRELNLMKAEYIAKMKTTGRADSYLPKDASDETPKPPKGKAPLKKVEVVEPEAASEFDDFTEDEDSDVKAE